MNIEINETSEKAVKKVVGTQVPQFIYEKLKTTAENDFMSISDLLRKIIYLYFKDLDEKEKNK